MVVATQRKVKIFRATNPEIMRLIYPHLVEDGEYTRRIIAKDILGMMTAAPNEIFVAVAFDKEEELVGYTIGWIPVERRYVWLGQSWSSGEYSRNELKDALELVKRWAANEHDIHEIRFETERNADAIVRAWGFELHGYIMNCRF